MTDTNSDERTAERLRGGLAEKVMLSDEQVVEFLFKRVVAEAENRSLNREYQRWTVIFVTIPVLIGIIGFIGFQSFSDLRSSVQRDVLAEVRTMIASPNFFTSEVDRAVQERLDADFRQRIDQINKDISLVRLMTLSSQVRQATDQAPAKRDALLQLLRDLSSDARITAAPEFASALEDVVDAFYFVDLDSAIDEIESLFSKLMEHHAGITHTMILHYGERVLGDPAVSEETRKRFEHYVQAGRGLRRAVAYAYILVNEFSNGGEGREARIRAYLDDVKSWESEDKSQFNEHIDYTNDSTPRVQRVNDSFKAFREGYRGDLDLIQP